MTPKQEFRMYTGGIAAVVGAALAIIIFGGNAAPNSVRALPAYPDNFVYEYVDPATGTRYLVFSSGHPVAAPPTALGAQLPERRKHIDLGVYNEQDRTFTLPDGRVVPAPITNQTLLAPEKK